VSDPKWQVDDTSTPGLVRCVLRGALDVADVEAFVAAHNRAVDAMAGRDYKVWVDLRDLAPLSPEAAAVMERAKRYSSRRPNFRGSAVLASGATVAMQHRRTSVAGGVMDSEFISNDEAACLRHLAAVWRTPAAKAAPLARKRRA
jgi:hypothetical protein